MRAARNAPAETHNEELERLRKGEGGLGRAGQRAARPKRLRRGGCNPQNSCPPRKGQVATSFICTNGIYVYYVENLCKLMKTYTTLKGRAGLSHTYNRTSHSSNIFLIKFFLN